MTTCKKNETEKSVETVLGVNQINCCSCVKIIYDFTRRSSNWTATQCFEDYEDNKINVTALTQLVLSSFESQGLVDFQTLSFQANFNQLIIDIEQTVELVLTWSKTFGLMLLIANGLFVGCLGPMSIILWYYSKILKHIRISEQRLSCTTAGKTRHMRHILYYTTAFITFGLPFWLTKRLLLAFKVSLRRKFEFYL